MDAVNTNASPADTAAEAPETVEPLSEKKITDVLAFTASISAHSNLPHYQEAMAIVIDLAHGKVAYHTLLRRARALIEATLVEAVES